MDLLDIVILAAAALGVIAFVVLAVVIVRQGRSLKRLEERVGPPVPMAAAPSLERVRALTSQVEVRVDVAEASAQPGVRPPGVTPASVRAEVRKGQKAPTSARSGSAAGHGAGPPSPGRTPGGAHASKGGNGALVALIVMAVALVGGGTWFFFLRGDGGTGSQSAATSTTTTTGTTGTDGTTTTDAGGVVPEDVPPIANKAAYTVAVLNASGVSGAAANRVAPRVQAAGYTLGVVDNATKQDLAVSHVEYVAGRQEVAWNLAKDLGITTAVPAGTLAEGRIGTADVAVIVGADLAK